ncbi:MAG: hypothetical protein ACREBU_02180 [Nitrososphaera sp.]
MIVQTPHRIASSCLTSNRYTIELQTQAVVQASLSYRAIRRVRNYLSWLNVWKYYMRSSKRKFGEPARKAMGVESHSPRLLVVESTRIF